MQDRRKQYWFFANTAACWSRGHVHFLRYGREKKAEECHTCFASLHGNKDHPSQRRSGCRREANLGSLKSTLHEMAFTPSLSIRLLWCLSITSPVSLSQAVLPPLSHHHFFYLSRNAVLSSSSNKQLQCFWLLPLLALSHWTDNLPPTTNIRLLHSLVKDAIFILHLRSVQSCSCMQHSTVQLTPHAN